MIYRGFNEKELNKIKEILDRNNVEYDISVPQESMDYIQDTTKRVNHRFMDNLLQIEIDKLEFDKINKNDVSKLFDLRIYPEEESPFTEEELAALPPEGSKPEIKADKNAKINQVATYLAVAVIILFYVWKNGYFK